MNYSKFVDGIDDIAAIELDLGLAYAKVQEAQAALVSVKDNARTGTRVCQGSVLKAKAAQVLDIAGKLQRTRDIGQELR